MSESGPDRIVLWQFPEADLAAWQELTGETMSYRAYTDLLAAVQADQERQGRRVVRVRFSVAEMRRRLGEAGYPNDRQHRAAITGCWPARPPAVAQDPEESDADEI